MKGLNIPYFYRILISYSFILGCFCSCNKESNENANSSLNHNEQQIYNWHEPIIDYAQGFSLKYTGTYKILDVYSPFQDTKDTLHYVLIPKGNTVPDSLKAYQQITIPVKKMILTSTTHVAMLAHLDKLDIVTGLTDAAFVFNPEVKSLIEKDSIKEVGKNGSLNMEVIIADETDLVISGAWSSTAYDAYRPLLNAGIPVMIDAEWTEPHPLGRMEWIKVFGALLNEENNAQKLYENSKSEYESLVLKTKNLDNKPTVINGTPYQEAWSIAGGNSFVGTLFKDAGADWYWAQDTSKVSYQMDFESVYPIGLKADYWIAPGRATDLSGLQTIDERFSEFNSFKNNQVYNFHGRANENGMYDYYESGVVKPETILADLIKILHPDILPEHELFYFKKLD